jgi:hypothetical protein
MSARSWARDGSPDLDRGADSCRKHWWSALGPPSSAAKTISVLSPVGRSRSVIGAPWQSELSCHADGVRRLRERRVAGLWEDVGHSGRREGRAEMVVEAYAESLLRKMIGSQQTVPDEDGDHPVSCQAEPRVCRFKLQGS